MPPIIIKCFSAPGSRDAIHYTQLMLCPVSEDAPHYNQMFLCS
jgi:hypothetical protein